MSQYFFKEGEKLTECVWRLNVPEDIGKSRKKHFDVNVFKFAEDPEQISVSVGNSKNYVVTEDRKDFILSGVTRVLNRKGFMVIDSNTGKTVERIIYIRPIVKK